MNRRIPHPHQLDSVVVINIGSAISDGTVGDISDVGGVQLAPALEEVSSGLLCALSEPSTDRRRGAEEQLKYGAVAAEQGGSSEHEAFSADGCSSK